MHGRISRSARLCMCCEEADREDEIHFALRCERYSDIRDMFDKFDFASEFLSDEHVRILINPTREDNAMEFWQQFSRFLLACKIRREESLLHDCSLE